MGKPGALLAAGGSMTRILTGDRREVLKMQAGLFCAPACVPGAGGAQ